jgi:hypothetical protein
MAQIEKNEWQEYEKVLFRFFFIYFLIQAIPLFDWKFYRDLFSVNWLYVGYRDIFYLSRFQPGFFGEKVSFADWGIIAVIAVIGTVIWTLRDKTSKEYQNLYYWLRVVLRYRLALGIIAYGFIKFFPLQSPVPSISNLNTAYGDFSDWKIFSLTLGIVPNYESFLGLVEIISGLLLLHRKTATIATLIILPFTGNVFMSNLAYEGGEYVYSLYLISVALFILSYDIIRIIRLLSFEQPTLPARFKPVFTEKWQQTTRIVLKSAFVVVFVFFYGFKTYAGYQKGSYHFPSVPGLAGVEGIYNVSEYQVNHKTVPFAKNDPRRWQNVVFEKWATLSIKSNRPVKPETAETEEIYTDDAQRNYEFAGAAGRHYYNYTFDSSSNTLRLNNRNKNYAGETLTLHFSKSGENQLILSGQNENKDSVYVVLDKINKKYLLEEAKKTGRNQRLKL